MKRADPILSKTSSEKPSDPSLRAVNEKNSSSAYNLKRELGEGRRGQPGLPVKELYTCVQSSEEIIQNSPEQGSGGIEDGQ